MSEAEERIFSIFVSPLEGVLDPAGQAALGALHSLGYGEVEDVRIGKYIILTTRGGSEERVREMCERLLANPIIEEYRIESG